MTESTTKETASIDHLICPITLELFRDPVKAKDGHVYERRAITRWILQHGTSPLTRQPLEINDLVADDELQSLARARRNSTVSYKSQDEEVTLPPLQRNVGYSNRIAPAEVSFRRGINCSFHKHCCILVCVILLCVVAPICTTVSMILLSRTNQGKIFLLIS